MLKSLNQIMILLTLTANQTYQNCLGTRVCLTIPKPVKAGPISPDA
jgi:hypothetical protein